MSAIKQLPRYMSHKQVWVLKIEEVTPAEDGGAYINPVENGYETFKVDADYVAKHKSEAGDYYVAYEDGYKSFSPASAFESGYTSLDVAHDAKLTFGEALHALESGQKVARDGWNGKGMFLYHVPANEYPAVTEVGKSIADESGKVSYGAYLAMKTAQGNVVPWLASQTDVLSKDWVIVP